MFANKFRQRNKTIKEITKTIAKLIYPSPNIVWDRDNPLGPLILSMDRAKDLIDITLKLL